MSNYVVYNAYLVGQKSVKKAPEEKSHSLFQVTSSELGDTVTASEKIKLFLSF